MDKQYYLDEQGVIKLVSSISQKIKDNTSKTIEVTETTDEETGETVKEAVNPNNFTTTKSVVDYLKNRRKITINQQNTSNSLDSEDYSVLNNIYLYNGEDEVLIHMNLATSEDIRSLFNNF